MINYRNTLIALSNISQAVDGYDKLDQTTKTFASNFISNMDIDPSKMLDTDYLDKQEKTVENLTKKLTQNKDVQDKIKDFQKTQANGKMNANKWKQNVNDQFTALQKSTGIDKDTLALMIKTMYCLLLVKILLKCRKH